jgi:hypothetical protein
MENNSINSTATPKRKRTGLIIGGVIALIVLLGGAAFVGGRLLNQAAPAGGSGGMVIGGGPAGGQQVSVQLVRAKELPTAEPEATGLFAERKDNSIYVTIGDKFMVRVDKNGNVDTQTEGNGDKLEVVVTSDTTIYKDVTEHGLNGAPPSDGKVQQQVAPGSLDEIGTNSIISAWGERHGDRVIAKVLMYSQPMMIRKP